MKERIKEFIEYKGISAGDLANSLDVQRSNISHILNGRNKPGAALIEKLLLVFPDLNARWLLTGEGNMVEQEDRKVKVSENIGTTNKSEESNIGDQDGASSLSRNEKLIDKVVLLYADGTFSSFNNK